MGASSNGQILKWNGAAWEAAADETGIPTGTAGSIFFSDGAGSLLENNDQFFWDNTDNKLYLGPQITTTGNVKLNVNGATRTQGLKNSAGSAGTPSYRFTDDLNSGMYRIAADELGFSVGGNLALTIDEPRTGITNVLVNGAFSAQIRTESGASAITIAEDDYTVIIENATSVNLPNPSGSGVDVNTGKIHILKNITGGAIPISSYKDSNGSDSTSLATGVTQLQSDGTNWHQIN